MICKHCGSYDTQFDDHSTSTDIPCEIWYCHECGGWFYVERNYNMTKERNNVWQNQEVARSIEGS